MRRYNHKKRFTMIILALLLCLETMPVSAFAEEETFPERFALESEFGEEFISDDSVHTRSKQLNRDLYCEVSENLETIEIEEDVKQSILTFTYDETVPESRSETLEPLTTGSGKNISLDTESFVRDDVFEDLSLNRDIIPDINADSTSTQSSTITVVYYRKVTDETSYEKLDSSSCQLEDGEEYYASNSFPGMTFSEYFWSNSTEDPGDAVAWLTGQQGEDGEISCGEKESNSVLHLRYVPKYYNLTFKDAQFSGEPSILKTIEIPFGSCFSEYMDQAPSDVGKEDYAFMGWYLDSQCTDGFNWTGKMYASDVTVYAGWEKCNYRVMINLCDDADSPAIYNSELSFLVPAFERIKLTTPSRPGYEYKGLYSDPDYDQEFSETMAISAAIKEIDMSYPSSHEYENGLEENGVLLHGAENETNHVAGKLNLYVKWEKVETVSLRIVYDTNGGDNAPVDPEDYYGQDYAAAHSVCTAPDGKAFLCWTYMDVTTGEEVEVYPGHYFPLQQAEKTITEENGSRFLTVILKAKYVEKQIPGKVTVVFDPNGGVGDCSITVEANQTFSIPSENEAGIVRDGYCLLGWNTAADGSGEFFEIGENAAANTSGINMLYAVWDPEITLLFSVNQAEFGNVDKDRITIFQHEQGSISVIADANKHCIFTGWLLNGEVISTDNILYLSMPEGGWVNVEYQAVFERETLAVLYELDADDVENAPGIQRIPYGERAIRPENPIRNGYRFAGWKSGESDYDFALPVTKDLTLTAQWKQEYYIFYTLFSSGSGKQLNISPTENKGYLPGETVTIQDNPMNPIGFENFSGWNTNDVLVQSDNFIMPENNVVFTGTFTPILYKITYGLQGGREDGNNPNQYTVESEPVTLKCPIREGYDFSGWKGSNGTEAQTEVTIPAGSTGDLSYTATWSPSLNTTYHVVVHYPVDWIIPESIEDAEINLEQRTVSYACTGMTGSVVNTREFRSPDDLRLTYDSEHPDNVPQGNIEPDGTLVLHAYLKRVEYLYTVQFCLRGTEKTVATKTGIAEPDSSGTAVTEVSLENAVFLDEYANYVSHMAIAGDNQVTVNKDNANVVVPIVIKVCVDRMDNRELYANGKEQYGYSIIEITGTAFSSDSEDGHITVSGLLPGDSMTIDFIPASGTNVGTYLPVYNGASFYTGESRVQYYTFDGFDPQTMGRLTILETVTVTWINGDDVLCVDPYVPPGSVPIYYAETPIKLSDFRYKYTFIGWNPEVGPVSKDTTYEAVFSKSFRLYTVTWENWDGTVAWQKDYNYGSTPMYGGPGQVKPEDAEYTYTFSSWTPAISEVDGNAVYKPVFTRTPRKYLVTYELNGVPYGSVLQKPFGETIMLSEDPQLEGYSFSGWSSEDVLIENRTFTMPSKNVIIVGSFSKIEKQVFDPNNLTEAQKAIAATGLTYNGTEQDLVTSPTSLPEGYTGLRFSTDNGETWNAIIPKATDAGEYLVLVQYVGDSRHEDFISDGISVAVEKAVITSFRASVFEELVYTGEERVLLAAVSDLPEGASVEYLVCDTDNHIYRDWSDELPYAVIPGSYQVYYRINGGKNYQSVLQTRIDNGSDQNTVITKADQNLPRKPSAVATDAHSITVDRTVIGQEYVLLPAGHVPSEDDWTENGRQASDGATLVFDNLSACQNYVVYTRKAANDCYNASNYIASETVTMPKESQSIPTSAVVATATCTSITVKSAYPSQEYSLDLGNSWLKASEGSNELTFENLKPNTEYRLISRMAETDTCSASEATDPITVKTLTGKIKTEVRTSGAATLDIAVTGLDEQLAKKLINTDEIERVLYGQTAAVYLLVSNNELSMSTSEKVLIEEAAKEKNKDAVVCMSLDISLYKQLESESPIAITSIGTDTIEITLEIPKQFRNTDANTERSFYIVRVHAGKAEILQPTVTGNSLTFSTGRFSTYAIFYVDRMESVSAAAGTESASGTATLASATGSATGTSVPTAASVSVTGTVAGNATYAGAGTTLAESAANEIKTETGEKTAENRTEWTDGIENRSNEPNTDIQRKDIIYENNYSTDDNSISGLFLQSARRTLLLIPLLGLIVTGYAAVRRRREKRSDEE